MRKTILLIGLSMFAVGLASVFALYGNENIANAAKKQWGSVLSTGPFTLNVGESVRALLRNPCAETELRYEAKIFDALTGNELAMRVFNIPPGQGISRTVEIPSFFDSLSIAVSVLVSGESQGNNIQCGTTISHGIVNETWGQKVAGIERLSAVTGDYQSIVIVGDVFSP